MHHVPGSKIIVIYTIVGPTMQQIFTTPIVVTSFGSTRTMDPTQRNVIHTGHNGGGALEGEWNSKPSHDLP